MGIGMVLLVLFLSGRLTPLPTALAFFRNPFRLNVLTGFGFGLLGAAALEAARARLSRRMAGFLATAVLVVVLFRGSTVLVSPTLDTVVPVARDAAAYRRLGNVARAAGGGSLLELPVLVPDRDMRLTDSMVASTLHGLPSITGFGPMFPLHWGLVERAIGDLPSREGLRELVDLTGLRWVVLRPAADWPDPRDRKVFARALATAGSFRTEEDGFLLQRVDMGSRHREWAQAIARGYRRGESLLGTPFEPGATGPLAASLDAPGHLDAQAGGVLSFEVGITNRGKAVWPGSLTGGGRAPGEIYVAARWQLVDVPGASAPLPESDLGLRRDLPGGESLVQRLLLAVPSAVGTYDLALDVRRRIPNASFSGTIARVRITVRDS